MPGLAIGGGERAMCLLAGAMAAAGREVDLVVPAVTDARVGVPDGVRLIELGPRRMVLAARRLDDYVRSARPAVLLTNGVVANALALGLRALRRWPVRIVAVEHTNLTRYARASGKRRHRLIPLVARLSYPRADALVAVSAGVGDDLRRHVRAERAARIEVVANPLAVELIAEQARARPSHPWLTDRDGPIFLAVGRLTPEKDFPTLLRALAIVRRSTPARLIVIGEGAERLRLERLVRRLGIGEGVRLVGSRMNPYADMARASTMVLSSCCEGAPTVLAEALVLGCRVVATDCDSGPREVLDNGRLGRLVPVGDPGALAQAMLASLSDVPPALSRAATDRLAPAAVARSYERLLFPERLEPAPV